MKNKIILIFVLFSATLLLAQKTNDSAIKYIKEYYAGFKTGYDTPGGYFTVTDNYNVELQESIFTISSDTYMYREFIKTETIQFDLKNVTSIYPNGTEILENYGNKTDDYQMILTLLCGRLAIKTPTKEYNLNIYYEVDADVEQSQIFKAFEILKKKYN